MTTTWSIIRYGRERSCTVSVSFGGVNGNITSELFQWSTTPLTLRSQTRLSHTTSWVINLGPSIHPLGYAYDYQQGCRIVSRKGCTWETKNEFIYTLHSSIAKNPEIRSPNSISVDQQPWRPPLSPFPTFLWTSWGSRRRSFYTLRQAFASPRYLGSLSFLFPADLGVLAGWRRAMSFPGWLRHSVLGYRFSYWRFCCRL